MRELHTYERTESRNKCTALAMGENKQWSPISIGDGTSILKFVYKLSGIGGEQ